jgi:hypothetical protein
MGYACRWKDGKPCGMWEQYDCSGKPTMIYEWKESVGGRDFTIHCLKEEYKIK